MRHVVVMVASSYPRFPGDGIGSFMEPIAKGVAARGHEVHLVAPWHPALTRGRVEDGVFFHFYRYAPVEALNVFGYAGGLHTDTRLKLRAWMAAPPALAAGWFKAWRVATKRRATVMHGHWVIPGGATAALASGRTPLVVSLHGSDVYVAERYGVVRQVARRVLGRAQWVTACSDDLRNRAVALGACRSQTETIPYGVDSTRFTPDAAVRAEVRRTLGVTSGPLIFTAGRLVTKKGFAYLIDAAIALAARHPDLKLCIAGDGDLWQTLTARAAAAGAPVQFLGNRLQPDIARLAAAADVVVVPSVHDEKGNVDGLPNFALEALATATPVIATRAGGLPQIIEDGVSGRLVAERDTAALAVAIDDVIANPARSRMWGEAGRTRVIREFGWARVAERLEAAYDHIQVGKQTLSEAAGEC